MACNLGEEVILFGKQNAEQLTTVVTILEEVEAVTFEVVFDDKKKEALSLLFLFFYPRQKLLIGIV